MQEDKEKTMKKLTKIAIALFGATTLGFAGFGAYTFADNFWQGHSNMVQINNDLDQLSQTIKNKNDQLTKAKSDLTEAKKLRPTHMLLKPLIKLLMTLKMTMNVITGRR